MAVENVSRPGEDLAAADRRAPAVPLAELAVGCVATVLMLQSMRVFVSYLVFVVDQSNRTTLAGIAGGVFLASGLGWLAVKASGLRWTLIASAVTLAATRSALQFWRAPEARMWLGAVAVIAWGWLVYSMLISRRDVVALGLGLGLALDLGIRVAFRTVDTPWMPSISSDAVTLVLVAGLLWSLAQFERWGSLQSWGRRSSISLLVIGPALALYLLTFGNLGLAQARLGLDFPGASVVLTFGMAIGVLASALRCSGEIGVLSDARWRFAWRVGLVVCVVLGFRWFWLGRPLSAIGLMLGSAGSVVLLTESLLDDPRDTATSESALPSLLFALGLLLEVGLLFSYYTQSGSPAVLAVIVAIFLAGSLLASAVPVARPRDGGYPVVVLAGVIGGLLLMVSGWQVWSWNDAAASSAIGPKITVMTYNIQTGFSAGDRFDLDQTARVIEAQHPDIVVLQEVSRGWLVTSGVDEVLWLSQRLNMSYAFGANSDDGMWGNVILSRAPIDEVRKVQYGETENLKRSVLEVQIATQEGDLWVLATHLDDPRDAGAIRLRQAKELVSVWNHRSPALLMGDMNSDPSDPVISLFESAGFVDFGATGSQTTSHDARRIDYVFGTQNIALESLRVPNVWTSDHRPVVAHVRLLTDQSRIRSSGLTTRTP